VPQINESQLATQPVKQHLSPSIAGGTEDTEYNEEEGAEPIENLFQYFRPSQPSSSAATEAHSSQQLNEEQCRVVQLARSGTSIFLTGAAGTGKTFALKSVIAALKSDGKEVHVTAATGVAANLLGGVTVHRWGGLDWMDTDPERCATPRPTRRHHPALTNPVPITTGSAPS